MANAVRGAGWRFLPNDPVPRQARSEWIGVISWWVIHAIPPCAAVAKNADRAAHPTGRRDRVPVDDLPHRACSSSPVIYVPDRGAALCRLRFQSRSWRGLGPAVFALSLLLFYRYPSRPRSLMVGNAGDPRDAPAGHRAASTAMCATRCISAFFLWALAQALLLANWIAGPAGLAGFGTLFALEGAARKAG